MTLCLGGCYTSHSDHVPIILNTEEERHKSKEKQKQRPFCFEKMWISNEDCEQIIEAGWTTTSRRGIAGKIKDISDELRIWNKTTFGHVGNKIKRIQEDLTEALKHQHEE